MCSLLFTVHNDNKNHINQPPVAKKKKANHNTQHLRISFFSKHDPILTPKENFQSQSMDLGLWLGEKYCFTERISQYSVWFQTFYLPGFFPHSSSSEKPLCQDTLYAAGDSGAHSLTWTLSTSHTTRLMHVSGCHGGGFMHGADPLPLSYHSTPQSLKVPA